MAEKMTLGRHAEKIRRIAEHMAKDGFGGWADSCVQAADAIDAHLTQPAQAVDVGALITDVCDTEPADPDKPDTVCIDVHLLTEIVERHTRAIGNAQAEGWTRAGTLNVQRWKGIDSMINTDFDYASDLPDGTYQLFTPTPSTRATPNAHE